MRPCREKVFGEARGIPLDRNAKARIIAYAKGYNARMKQPGQHWGPITRAYMQVLEALLWGFHNSRDGRCFPSYETIAARARCNRDTVYEAIKALEFADILADIVADCGDREWGKQIKLPFKREAPGGGQIYKWCTGQEIVGQQAVQH